MNWLPEALKHGKLLVAVSGGVDSLYLLIHLQEASQKHPFQVFAGHVDHQIRQDSRDDARFVEEFCARHCIKLLQRTLNPDSQAHEGALRAGRIAALRDMATEASTPVIALGHHRDDLAETFLLMALRGSGARGLASMREIAQWPGGFTVIRPLLNMSRAQIEGEMRRLNISWREDPTNSQLHHRRNFIRHRVLPLLEELEPASRELIARSARLVGDADADHWGVCRKDLSIVTLAKSSAAILLSIILLKNIPSHRHGEIIRQAADTLSDPAGITPIHPSHDRLTDLLASITGSRSDPATFNLSPGLDGWLGNGYLLLHQGTPVREAFLSVREGLPALIAELPNPVPVGAIGSSMELPGGITIEVDDGNMDPSGPGEAVLSLGSPDNGIDIRTVSLDDTISLPGGGKKKAGDCLREGHVPAPVRRDVLGIYVNGKLQWIPGLRQSHDSIFSHDTEGNHIGIRITRDGMPL